jgi:twitching motility protein PilT
LEQDGSADLSYSLPGKARFRVNIFRQRGTCAIVMRVIPNTIPDFAALCLPPQLVEIADLRTGIVLHIALFRNINARTIPPDGSFT